MTFNHQKYYKELKNRFILTFLAWIFCLSICYYYKETILFILINSSGERPYFIFTNVTEVLYVYVELVLFVSNQITLVILTYQAFMFLSLGLYQFELEKIKLLFQLFTLTWFFALFLLFNFVVPLTWKFFSEFQIDSAGKQLVSFFFEAKLDEYLRYFISLYYICLINCQFLIFLLIMLNNLNDRLKKTKKFRKFFYLMFLIFSTIVTPPDVPSQVYISGILVIVYEFVILLKEVKTNMVTS